jgi:hypothetical protein
MMVESDIRPWNGGKMKKCISCGITKNLSEFYTHKNMSDGHLNRCKECVKARVMKHRLANLDRIREYDRARSKLPHRMQKNRDVAARWRAANPLRRAAQIALRNAVRDGRVIPWPVCAVPECEDTKVEAHHPDYDQPLQVVWLCSAHHKQCHHMKGLK